MGLVSSQRAFWLGERIFPHEPELRAWLARRTLSGVEVDDVVQETYAILAGLERVDHILNPRTYMFEVAKSVILQALRKSRVVTLDALAEATDGLQLPSEAPSPERIAADRQELGRLAVLISDLPPRCREAFTLRKVHGLSQREVARRLGVSENTVEKHIGKALGILTAALGRGGSRHARTCIERDPVQTSQLQPLARDRRRH